jgi:hydroxymethylpyrimidine/phosphomethylpyrimidine kinase
LIELVKMGRIPCALTIAGSDSGGGAGIQADLKTFAALRVHGMSAITSVTAQNTTSVTAIQDIPPEVITAQIDAVQEDIGVDAAKTGMLHTGLIIEAVAETIAKYGFKVVVDPVMISKSGTMLLEPEAKRILVNRLLPLATVVTPNLPEASAISGTTIKSLDDSIAAAKEISRLGPKAVVVKGGHLAGNKAIDVLYAEKDVTILEIEKVESKTTHGTGCSFSAAIAAELAKGRSVGEAVSSAKELVHSSIKFGLEIGRGFGPVNPMARLYNEAEKYAAIREVRKAVGMLEDTPDVAAVIPEVQSNLCMALSYAESVQDVVAIPGRVVKTERGAKATSCPEFGASKHVARTLLTVRSYEPSIRSAMNIRYLKELVEICERLGLTVSSYDRREEPEEIKQKEGMSVQWGAEVAIKSIGKVPNVIYHTGDLGKEPMMTVFGRTPTEVAELAIKLAKEYIQIRTES